MGLTITSLNSGSNGNCYYIGNNEEAVLIDAGISCREIEKRMGRLGLSMGKVKALFVTHEHADHIRGIPSLVKKYRYPVYITPPTLSHCGFALDEPCVKTFVRYETISIGGLNITAFPKKHDASDPYCFIVDCNQIKVGVFTDLGKPCEDVIYHFKQCHAAFLEANYDEEMLEVGRYPYYLKKRIRSELGHLSNNQALEFYKKYRPKFMTHLFLSHLSNNNNCPDLVNKLFTQHANGVNIVVASRYKETELYHIASKPDSSFVKQLSFSFA